MKRILLFVAITAAAFAQSSTEWPTGNRTTPPTINSVTPPSVARGATVEMNVDGLNLARTSAGYFSEPRVKARIGRIKALPDLPDIREGSNGAPSTAALRSRSGFQSATGGRHLRCESEPGEGIRRRWRPRHQHVRLPVCEGRNLLRPRVRLPGERQCSPFLSHQGRPLPAGGGRVSPGIAEGEDGRDSTDRLQPGRG